MEPSSTSPQRALPEPIAANQPLTALAPMQDVTDLPFMTVISECGSPDYFFTEFLRVHIQSTIEKSILEAITKNETGRPIFPQLIGEDIFHLQRTVDLLLPYDIAGIDLNLGCPAPKVYRKNVGGGLLRDPRRIDDILAALRASTSGLFTVKMRIGFEDTRHFEELLEIVNKHDVDLLSVHGRTVKEMYRSEVHYDCIKRAVEIVNCPVLANGDVSSAKRSREILDYTGAAGVMIGRHAIRNPWIFKQIREYESGQIVSKIPLIDVRQYVERLYESVRRPWIKEKQHVNKMKKYLNFVGQGVDPEGRYLHDMRRTQTEKDLFDVCDRYMIDSDLEYFADEPYEGLLARPSRES